MKALIALLLLLPAAAMAGPFEDALNRICPAKHLERLTPGSLDMGLQDFAEGLAPRPRAALQNRMQAADKRDCAHVEMGLSCSNHAALRAMRPAEIAAFARRLCRAPVVCREGEACNLPGS